MLLLATTRVLLGLVNWIKGMLANKVGVQLTAELRLQLVRKLHSLGVGYYDRHQVGSLVSRVAYDSEVLHSLLQQITGGFLLQLVQVIAVGAMLFTLNAKLALYVLIPTPLIIGGSVFFWKRVYPELLSILGFEQQAGGHALGDAAGHPRREGLCPGTARAGAGFAGRAITCGGARETVEKANTSFTSIMAVIFSLGGLIVWYAGGRDVLSVDDDASVR